MSVFFLLDASHHARSRATNGLLSAGHGALQARRAPEHARMRPRTVAVARRRRRQAQSRLPGCMRSCCVCASIHLAATARHAWHDKRRIPPAARTHAEACDVTVCLHRARRRPPAMFAVAGIESMQKQAPRRLSGVGEWMISDRLAAVVLMPPWMRPSARYRIRKIRHHGRDLWFAEGPASLRAHG